MSLTGARGERLRVFGSEPQADGDQGVKLAMEAGGDETPSFWSRLLQDSLETLLLAVVLFVAVRSTLQNTRVDGPSMEPTLYRGQYLMVNKLIYRLSDPKRGDIVVFANPRGEGPALIKRLIGLPGEQIAIRNGQVSINGAPVQEPYVVLDRGSSNWGPQVLGPDDYMFLGDNRTNSNDSRTFGPVKGVKIIGKAWFSIWPPSLSVGLPHSDGLAKGTQAAGTGVRQ